MSLSGAAASLQLLCFCVSNVFLERQEMKCDTNTNSTALSLKPHHHVKVAVHSGEHLPYSSLHPAPPVASQSFSPPAPTNSID
eukprot:14740211-Ditylum_brightwellii.AAC.1